MMYPPNNFDAEKKYLGNLLSDDFESAFANDGIGRNVGRSSSDSAIKTIDQLDFGETGFGGVMRVNRESNFTVHTQPSFVDQFSGSGANGMDNSWESPGGFYGDFHPSNNMYNGQYGNHYYQDGFTSPHMGSPRISPPSMGYVSQQPGTSQFVHQNYMLQKRSTSSPSFDAPPFEMTNSFNRSRRRVSSAHIENPYTEIPNYGDVMTIRSPTIQTSQQQSSSEYQDTVFSTPQLNHSRSSPSLAIQVDSYLQEGYGYFGKKQSREGGRGFFRSQSSKKLSQRSLLEEFRTSKNNNHFTLRDIAGHMIEFSGDQYGSRFIQQKLESCSDEEKDLVFREIFPRSLQLMMDVFGNYVIQKFFEHGTLEERTLLTESIKGYIVKLSMHVYGCRIVQKAIETMDESHQIAIVDELKDSILECIKDQNGNHVVQKIIEEVDPVHTGFIVDQFVDNVYELSTHGFGCRVIQRVLQYFCLGKHFSSYYDYPGSQAETILEQLFEETPHIVEDQYGNYVVQHVLKFGRPEDINRIVEILKGNVVEYCQHKYASNVVEKCIIYGGHQDKQAIIEELVENPDSLNLMLKHQYGNYVIQKILDECNKNQRDFLVQHITPFVTSLKKYTYGKHILSRLEKLQN
eukprot:TRINITY_DN139_c0_g1_i1.p1 TRINITY_DN139_c0_g1~~TRINITY_DN139_c0_g1_i1.p1  ORF type:complete len:630 (+),score=121.23 TRINITY_DN139_c0_g1_i1:2021-3910(+)